MKAPRELKRYVGSIVHLRPSPSVAVRPSEILNDFSETKEPTVIEFYLESPGLAGLKCCSNGPGHMTNIVAMHIHMNFNGSNRVGPCKLVVLLFSFSVLVEHQNNSLQT